MPVENPTRARAVIGVVGKTISITFKEDEELDPKELVLVEAAEQVGREIAVEEHVVLTGGHHLRPEVSVKYRAMHGAANAGKTARLVGILPKGISRALATRVEDVGVEADASGQLRYVYVHTQLSSEERNPINGQAPDVLIALYGGGGTIQELEEALRSERAVVFLNSWDVLGKKLASGLRPEKPLKATSAPEAVKMALKAIACGTPSPGLNGRFPDPFPLLANYSRIAKDYERALLSVCL